MYTPILIGEINKTIRHKSFPPHKHYKDEMYICFSGSATDITEEKQKNVSIGDVYVRRKGVIHAQSDIKDFFCCVFQFDREELLKRSKEMGLYNKESFATLFLSEDNLNGIFIDTKAVKHAEIISDLIKEEKDLSIRDILFLNLLTVICSREKKSDAEPCQSIKEVVRFLEHNYDKPLSLEILSEQSHYSRRHFTRLFRKMYGVSPMEYLNCIRIKNASDLLVKSDMNIIEISRLCGFEDNNLFSRHFKAFYKMSPTEYRQLNRIK